MSKSHLRGNVRSLGTRGRVRADRFKIRVRLGTGGRVRADRRGSGGISMDTYKVRAPRVSFKFRHSSLQGRGQGQAGSQS